ncbi:MAG TPA: DUF3443 family protein [Terriglobales bacterium]|nr:DUF3443 family protein [Terriglobales bacterium]
MRKSLTVVLFSALSLTFGCGGNSGGSAPPPPPAASGCTSGTNNTMTTSLTPISGQNVASVVIDGGLPNIPYVNGIFTTVTVCQPGSTTSCQTIDHVLVDTGSFGLRLLAAGTSGGKLSLALPAETDGPGSPVAECAQFSDGITWGAVRLADVRIGGSTANNMSGELAANIPVQVIGDTTVPTVPAGCTQFGTPEDDVNKLLTNGILGVGEFPQDCGPGCTTSTTPGLYYHCPGGTCTQALMPLQLQVLNPVAAFSPETNGVADNNGVALQLPQIAPTGAMTVNGFLIFGIGTQSNNGLGSAHVFAADPNNGNFSTVFAGQTLSNSFLDSGSNGFFFNDSSISKCTTGSVDFFCTGGSNLTCTATNQSAPNTPATSGNVTFGVNDANALISTNNNAFNNLAGPNPPPPNPGGGTPPPSGFDWGLPFFFGKTVFTGMENLNITPPPNVPQGPFFAY